MKDLIYLAAPYTSDSESIQQWRYDQLVLVCTSLIQDGFAVICSIVHCHPIYITGKAKGIRPDFQFWLEYNKALLWSCDELMICTLPCWETSVGVQQELEWAKYLGQPINLVDWQTYKITPYATHPTP